jgi:hypothetical protein
MEEFLLRERKLAIDLPFINASLRKSPKYRYAHLPKSDLAIQLMDDSTLLYQKFILCSPDNLLTDHELLIKADLIESYEVFEQLEEHERERVHRQLEKLPAEPLKRARNPAVDTTEAAHPAIVEQSQLQTQEDAPGWFGSVWGWLTGSSPTAQLTATPQLQTPSSEPEIIQDGAGEDDIPEDQDMMLDQSAQDIENEENEENEIMIEEEVYELKPRVLKPNRPSKYLPKLPLTPYSEFDITQLDPIQMAKQRQLYWFQRAQAGRNNEYFDPLDLDADDLEDYDAMPVDPIVIEAHRLDPTLGLNLRPGGSHVLRAGTIPEEQKLIRQANQDFRQMEKFQLLEIQQMQEKAFQQLPPTSWGILSQELLRRHYQEQRDELYTLFGVDDRPKF